MDFSIFNEVRKMLEMFDKSKRVRVFMWAMLFIAFLYVCGNLITAIRWW